MIAVIRLPRLAGDNIPSMANTEKAMERFYKVANGSMSLVRTKCYLQT